jgi:hypothetical protein
MATAGDLGDQFRFTIGPGRLIAQVGRTLRVPVVAFVGASEFASFRVDLVAGLTMTGVPERVRPIVAIDLPGLLRTPYRAYPVVDHIADKVCALLEVHQRSGCPAIAATSSISWSLHIPPPSTRSRWQLRFTDARVAHETPQISGE